jgi:hypothetical protein
MSTAAQPLVVTTIPTAHRIEISAVVTVTGAQAIGRAVAGVTQTATIKPA